MGDGMTSPFPYINGCTLEVWEWTSNFMPGSKLFHVASLETITDEPYVSFTYLMYFYIANEILIIKRMFSLRDEIDDQNDISYIPIYIFTLLCNQTLYC